MTVNPTQSLEGLFATGLWSQAPQSFDSLFKANARATEVWLASWSKIAKESASFMTRRWTEDKALLEKIVTCKHPAEVLQVQNDFLQSAFADYLQNAKTMMQMETEASAAGFEAYDTAAKHVLAQAEQNQEAANAAAGKAGTKTA